LPFSPDYVFFKAIDYDFDVAWLDPDAELSGLAKAAKSVIESILGPGDSTDYFLQLCGRKLATESADKCCFHIIVGETSCGKGVLEAFFKATFPDIHDSTDASCLTRNSCRGTGLRDKEFLVPLQGKTFVFTQEITSSDEMNGEVIKSIISGGDKQTCRETRGKIQHFILDLMLMVCCNKVPVITPSDDAIAGRMTVFMPPYKYVKQAELESGEAPSYYRLEDPLVKETVKTAAMRLGLVELLVRNYVRVEPDRPPKIAADTQRMLDKSKSYDPASKIDLKPFVQYTGKLGDFVIYQDLLHNIESAGITHIDNKQISAALFNMGQWVTKTRCRVPRREGMSMCYNGLVLKEYHSPEVSAHVPELHYGSYFNIQLQKKPRIESSDNEEVTAGTSAMDDEYAAVSGDES
jgi:hypothetical protein